MMHIGILFPMDTVRNSLGQASRMWGRVVANHDFLLAVAASSNDRQITVFVPTGRDKDILQQTLLSKFIAQVSVVSYFEITSYLEKNPIDVLHRLDPNLFVATHIRNTMSERPFVVTGITHSLANQHFLAWALLNNANGLFPDDCLICTTPTAEKVVTSVFSRLSSNQPEFVTPQTHVIPLGMSLDAFTGGGKTARKIIGVAEDCFLILAFSRFDSHFKMDFMPLLTLASLVRNASNRSVQFLLAGSSGDGRYGQFLQQWVKDNGLEDTVRFVLNPTDEHKFEIFKAADVFLSLSDNVQETFGLTIIEAMSAGLPVVASDWDGYKVLVTNAVTGYLVPTKTMRPDTQWEAILAMQEDPIAHLFTAQTTAVDLEFARDRLIELSEDAGLVSRMGVAARESAKQYDWSAVIRQYFDLWTKLREKQLGRIAFEGAGQRSSALGFQSDFSCYPTSYLSVNDRFVTSPLGKRVLSGEVSAHLLPEVEEFLDFGIMQEILKSCMNVRSISELGGSVPSEKGDRQIEQNVLWLYKYGFLEPRQ
jgi:D-inositol-3-phosphate glycosyltransferase